MIDFLKYLVDIVIHLDTHLGELVAYFGIWTYVVLFLIVFAETGFVVTPFLPGDSLLFATGALAATTGTLNPHLVILILACAAILGDTVNYWIGHYLGPRVFSKQKSFFFNPEHLQKTHKFYEKYGGKTIILARFIPIIRTFAPFVAGIGRMTYSQFIFYNILGAIFWVPSFVYIGYYFGNLPFVKENFSLVILAIIVISILPGVIEILRHSRAKKKPSETSEPKTPQE